MANINCIWTQPRFGDYLDRTLSTQDREAMRRHLSDCPHCEQSLAMTREALQGLAELDDVALPSGFSQRLSARLHQESEQIRLAPKPVDRKPLLAWLRPLWPAGAVVGTALAAMLALVMVSPNGSLPTATGPQTMVATPVNMTMGSDAHIRIWFESDQAVEQVRFRLELPPGLRVVNGNQVLDDTVLTWVGRLQAGRNLIPLQIRGVAQGDWKVHASVEKDGVRKASTVGLRVDGV